jgi:hypothetical protein
MQLRVDGERLREMAAPLLVARETLVVTKMRLPFDEARRSLHGETLFAKKERLFVSDERLVVNAKPLLLDERTLLRNSEPLLQDYETLLQTNGWHLAMKKSTHVRSPTLSSSKIRLSRDGL